MKDKGKDMGKELSEMLRGVPPQNILISFHDKPAKSLAEYAEERKRQGKKHKSKADRER